MSLVNLGDFTDLYIKLQQRGLRYIFSKLSFSANSRTRTTFNDPDLESANWWIIPAMQKRWNELITGKKELTYEDYFANNYLANSKGLEMLSVGCGNGGHELVFAKYDAIKAIHGIDIAANQILVARSMAETMNLQAKTRFYVADYSTTKFPGENFDIILFHSSLHHFRHMDKIIMKTKGILKSGGFLVINEYVGPNRFQWEKKQLKTVNIILRKIMPKKYKRVFKTSVYKNKVRSPGILRMIVNDPSEAIESKSILPCLNKHFQLIEIKEYGGNILMPLLKDISHHFIDDDETSNKLLERLFTVEDEYLKEHSSDFVFAVYKKF